MLDSDISKVTYYYNIHLSQFFRLAHGQNTHMRCRKMGRNSTSITIEIQVPRYIWYVSIDMK